MEKARVLAKPGRHGSRSFDPWLGGVSASRERFPPKPGTIPSAGATAWWRRLNETFSRARA
ncbi:hypothetical protein K461DRAFT_274010 [Myriangium duriaei CBS 260.36]|uniref:Uncharacterized protein n=1 Tax=Myriangium duriaei CBS 260.36 TaxID=1168546 RepID=A0A9P4MLW3_9PEZI|nr:hypothetical protein K461DRAFT_274010 [Myriangium duriaei CBS 260.36]